MTTFDDGPAQGIRLSLKRIPRFLRVVSCPPARKGPPLVTAAVLWDALDMPEDNPAADETIYAYELVKQSGTMHVNRGRHGSGWYPIANYRQVVPQPADAEMRDRMAWRQWCEEHGCPPP